MAVNRLFSSLSCLRISLRELDLLSIENVILLNSIHLLRSLQIEEDNFPTCKRIVARSRTDGLIDLHPKILPRAVYTLLCHTLSVVTNAMDAADPYHTIISILTTSTNESFRQLDSVIIVIISNSGCPHFSADMREAGRSRSTCGKTKARTGFTRVSGRH